MSYKAETSKSIKDNFFPIEIALNNNAILKNGIEDCVIGTTYFDGDIIFKEYGQKKLRPGFRVSALKFRRIIKWSFDKKNIRSATAIQTALLDYVIQKLDENYGSALTKYDMSLEKIDLIHDFFKTINIKMPVNPEKEKENLLNSIDPDIKI